MTRDECVATLLMTGWKLGASGEGWQRVDGPKMMLASRFAVPVSCWVLVHDRVCTVSLNTGPVCVMRNEDLINKIAVCDGVGFLNYLLKKQDELYKRSVIE